MIAPSRFGYALSVWMLGLADFNVSANSACVVERGMEQHIDARLPAFSPSGLRYRQWSARQATAESGVAEWASGAGKGVGRDAAGLLGRQASRQAEQARLDEE